ncbi:ABC transporter permease [Pseudactinotalea sp. HY158]|uniref:ABC transporter permease n=1 Tax=Pseudactinotalea sp. HY158 TaxID=2654547 RepID=UPI00129C521A|nr:ABC transporter permease [Pseudactinotalea sp. HY158]QGH70308.1 ABC transporter permease [Pseudactinotalea sp. HY158]
MTATTESPRLEAAAPREAVALRTPIILGVVGLLGLLAYLFLGPEGASTFKLSQSNDTFDVGEVTVPGRPAGIVLMLGALALAGSSFYLAYRRKKLPTWLTLGFGVLVLFAFLVWVVAGNNYGLPIPFLLSTTIIAALPLAFGAMAGVLCERSGTINIAIEGQLLAGAFMGATVGAATGSLYFGLIAAPIAGGLVGWLLAVFTVKYRVDQIIVGVVLNVLVLGLTNYLFSTVLSTNQSLRTPPALPELRIPLLADLPVIGNAFFNKNIMVYTMIVLIFVLQYLLFRSRWGLRMRSVGEHPKAADTVGINVNRTRYRNVILGSAIAGFGGASIVAAGLAFTKEATQGRGYIALAAMILGRWNPTGALAAAILFGFFDSLRRVLGNIDSPIPSELLSMLPYLATIFAVAGLVGRFRPPAAEGKPYPPE